MYGSGQIPLPQSEVLFAHRYWTVLDGCGYEVGCDLNMFTYRNMPLSC